MTALSSQLDLLTKPVSPFERILSAAEIARIDMALAHATTPDPDKLKTFIISLRILTSLGIRERNARALLGRWRRDHGDRAVHDAVEAARARVPADPAAWITACLTGAADRKLATDKLHKARYTLVGWERPVRTSRGPTFRHGRRGQVWRDPFGALTVLPCPDHIDPPSLAEEPGLAPDATP